MLEYHRTRDGDTMLIAEMTDDHLCNLVSLVLRKALDLKRAAQCPVEDASEYHRKLYDVREVTEESAAEATRMAMAKVYPYLAELYLRDLEGPRGMLIELLDRSEALPRQSAGQLLLNAPILDHERNDVPEF